MSLLKHIAQRRMSYRWLSTVTLPTVSNNKNCILQRSRTPSTELPMREKSTVGLSKFHGIISTDIRWKIPVRSFCDEVEIYGSSDSGHYVLLRGIPYHITEQHVIDFLEDVKVVGGAKGVTLILTKSGLRFGTAFAQVNSKEDVDKALLLNRNYISDRYIEVFRSDKRNLMADIEHFGVELVRSKTGHTVAMITISQDTTEQVIQEFFAPLTPVNIEFRKIVTRNWTNYKAYVDFSSHEEACQAMEKSGETLGDRLISLKLISYDGVCTAYQDD